MAIRSLADAVVAWLHAGELNAIVTYRKRVMLRLLCQVGAMLLLYFLPASFMHHPFILVVGAILVVPRTLFEGRRALILTSTELIYRPAFGPPRRILLANIAHLQRRKVPTVIYLRGRFVQGVELTLKNGEVEKVPLDFKGRPEIIQRLEASTGKSCDAAAKSLLKNLLGM